MEKKEERIPERKKRNNNLQKKKIREKKKEIKKNELDISLLDIDIDSSPKIKKDENNISKKDGINLKFYKLNKAEKQIFINFYNKISSDEEEDEKDSIDYKEILNTEKKENNFENKLYNQNISNSNNNIKQIESIKKETNLEKNFRNKTCITFYYNFINRKD